MTEASANLPTEDRGGRIVERQSEFSGAAEEPTVLPNTSTALFFKNRTDALDNVLVEQSQVESERALSGLSTFPLTPWFVRFELPIILTASFVGALSYWLVVGHNLVGSAFANMSSVLASSVLIAWGINHNLRKYANARQISYVLPVYAFVLMSAFSLVLFSKIEYSSGFLLTGACGAVCSSFILAIYHRRAVKPHFVVLAGRAGEIALNGQYLPAPPTRDLRRLVSQHANGWALVADLHYPHTAELERLFADASLAGVPVYHFRQIAELQSGQVKIDHLSENDLGSLTPNLPYITVKRSIDLAIAACLMPLVVPLFFVIGLAIKLDSRGPMLFVQERIGRGAVPFRVFKFRTMIDKVSCLEAGQCDRQKAITQADDDRITRIGAVLRRTRIDELPQLFNVLRGEMSIIGPRPEARALAEWYEEELPFYSYRHIVRPGITGWAQVNQGHVTEINDILSKLRFDFYYIKNLSMWLDILIILKTVRVIVTGSGAK